MRWQLLWTVADKFRLGSGLKIHSLVRGLVVALGVAVLSPLVVAVLRATASFGALAFILIIPLQILALAGVSWGLRSLAAGALAGAAAASPWALYFGTEAGPWVWLVTMPELVMLVALGWYGRRRESRPALRLLGSVVPTLLIAYAVLSPLIRGR